MAKLISGERIVPVWLEAVRSLNAAPKRTARNYVLEIRAPTLMRGDDARLIAAVDAELRKVDMSVETVAGTLFPNGLYRRYGRPAFYGHFMASMLRGKKPGTWGTYAMRLIERKHPRKKTTFNPLDIIVEKLRATTTGRRIHAAYELGVVDVADLAEESSTDVAYELPLYDPSTDGSRPTGIPCLSHLSFKLNDDDTVDVTAVYRSHHYAMRALGNLMGLSQLLAFVAHEAGLQPGSITCVSTQAFLDVDTWGGVHGTRALLASLPLSYV